MPIEMEHIQDGYLIRWYEKPGTLKYCGTITVVDRGNGEYELIGWMRPRNAPPSYPFGWMKELEDKFREEIPDFKCLTGTFDNRMLKAQKRLWRGHYELIPIRQVEKEFNGKILEGTYVRFRRLRNAKSNG